MTTVYSYQQIEEHIKKLGPLKLVTDAGNEVASNTFFNDTPEKLIEEYLTLIGYGGYRRVNQSGVIEGRWIRTTITDIYRIVINRFPDYSLEDAYKKLYSLIAEKKVHSFVCWDIFKRVYRGTTASPHYWGCPVVVDDGQSAPYKGIEVDEFGVQTEKFFPEKTPPDVVKIGVINSEVKLAVLVQI